MLQLLKIVFTFGKELLIVLCRGYKPSGLRLAIQLIQLIRCPKNERQQGKRRLLGSKKKYWIENIWKKHGIFLSEQRENNKGKLKKTKNDAGECFFGVPRRNWKNAKKDANVSSTFLVEIAKITQVTNITRSNLYKSLISFLDINVLIQ